MTDESLELEVGGGFELPSDQRPRMPEPPPVKLVAVSDVTLVMPPGVGARLDEFYVNLLGFERVEGDQPIYRSENFRLAFKLGPPIPESRDLRPLQIEVRSLVGTTERLGDAEISFTYERSVAGVESRLMRDPAGNWIELIELRIVG